MDRTALITGASRGIGAACARILASDGYRVIVNYLNSEREASALADELGGMAVRADVADKVQVEQMFKISGGVDVLVCNAGISIVGLFTDTPESSWRRLLDVNLAGAINCCQEAAERMVRRQNGRIIMLSSVWGVYGASCEAVYSASKAALAGLMKALSKELGPSGITVNCVAPGVIDTDMNADLTPETIATLTERTPLGRIGMPEDVANLVRFLASDEAKFITGQLIGVDGGFIG